MKAPCHRVAVAVFDIKAYLFLQVRIGSLILRLRRQIIRGNTAAIPPERIQPQHLDNILGHVPVAGFTGKVEQIPACFIGADDRAMAAAAQQLQCGYVLFVHSRMHQFYLFCLRQGKKVAPVKHRPQGIDVSLNHQFLRLVHHGCPSCSRYARQTRSNH